MRLVRPAPRGRPVPGPPAGERSGGGGAAARGRASSQGAQPSPARADAPVGLRIRCACVLLDSKGVHVIVTLVLLHFLAFFAGCILLHSLSFCIIMSKHLLVKLARPC